MPYLITSTGTPYTVRDGRTLYDPAYRVTADKPVPFVHLPNGCGPKGSKELHVETLSQRDWDAWIKENGKPAPIKPPPVKGDIETDPAMANEKARRNRIAAGPPKYVPPKPITMADGINKEKASKRPKAKPAEPRGASK